MLLRIAIILEKNLNKGAVGNVAAILMGQAATSRYDVYDQEPLLDESGNQHAGIQYSTVLLKAGQGQLLNLIEKISLEHKNMTCISFSEVGQNLHNEYPEYKKTIKRTPTKDLKPVGVLVIGDDSEVRDITKKFSVIQD